jgi:dipeptidyl aminopeptidase/acylaminoacyl peptidase
MMRITFIFFIFLCSNQLTAQLAPLSVDKIMKDPKKLIGTSPSGVYWSEDSKELYFHWNPDQEKSESLYAYSLKSKTIRKVPVEAQKTLPPPDGVYNHAKTQKLFTRNGDIFLQNTIDQSFRQLTNTVEPELSPSFSFDEQAIIFQRGQNLFSISLNPRADSPGVLTQHTDFRNSKQPEESKLSEQEAWLKQDQLALFEILSERKEAKDARAKLEKALKPLRPKEIYLDGKTLLKPVLSPDLKYVTYSLATPSKEAKSTVVPSYVTESGFTENLQARTKVGAKLAKNDFWVYDIAGDTAKKVSFRSLPGITDKPDFLKDYPRQDSVWGSKERDVYVSGPYYSRQSKHAVLVVRSVDNKDRWIVTLNLSDLSLRVLDRQRDEAWISGPGIGYNQSSGTVGWVSDTEFYYQSEASGYSHLYVVNVETGRTKQLTNGAFEVQEVKLSKDKKHFFLITNEVHPGEKHFYKMSVAGGERIRLTTREGMHEVTLSPDETKLAVRYSNSNSPWELFILENKRGSQYEQVTRSLTEEFTSYPWRSAKVVKITASDGKDIYARVYEPAESNGKAVIFVHGAGYLQNAHKGWSQYFREYMFHNLLVDRGYTVLDMDFRASAGYGRDWRTGIYRHMGGKDLSDNVDGAKWLVKNYKIDPRKIGIYGGSYGGFITLMAQFTAPGVFAAGAALRPVADWASYNQGYTSNILNEPQTDSLAYRRSSPIYHADGLKDKLLICHGMIDVNVHFQDVVRLSQRLIELGKENWELAVYPLEDHGFLESTSWRDEYKRIYKLFEEM